MGKSVIIAYVPVVSRAHLDFFEKQKLPVFVLASCFLKEFPILERDLRAITPEQAVVMLRTQGVKARLLTPRILDKLLLSKEFVLPVDEIMEEFAVRHLAQAKVDFVNVWLRWSRKMATAEIEVSPERIISIDSFDQEIMRQATAISTRNSEWWRQIGAILVRDGQPVITAYNHHEPTDFAPHENGDPRSNFTWGGDHIELCSSTHAEIGIISKAARLGISTEGAKLYVTTFPCPPCARAVINSGIKEVYYTTGYSMMDAEDLLRKAEVKIVLVKMP